MTPRLTQAQKKAMHHIDLNDFIDDSVLNWQQRITMEALERKGLAEISYDDDGCGFWARKSGEPYTTPHTAITQS